MNLIRAAWVLAPVAAVVYGVWFWPDTPEGQEQRRRSDQIEAAERLCERMQIAADNGRERIAAVDLCEAAKRAARKAPP